jgi:hypothetical protein
VTLAGATIPPMFSLARKIEAEHRMRELLLSADLPQPAAVEYGDACVRFFFEPQKVCVVVDLVDRDGGSGSGSGTNGNSGDSG